ncbi:kinetochore CENP-C fungal-like protein [Leptodontidium sp. 2 PMI_412]|nr:kinetochore CENP-C fungal-like protein [Leptodontidium sp. 2 PMI_412]
MAPEAARRKGTDNQYIFDLGKRGRKTGITVPDDGFRDENGLEQMDHLFSSPEKPKELPARRINGNRKNIDKTISSEADMDVDESTIPEPADVLTERKRTSTRLPPPRSKSPIKTFLQSPARRNPSLGPVSSPIRGSIVEPRVATTSASVRRRLDFSNTSFDSNGDTVMTNGSPQKRATSELPARSAAKLTNGKLLAPFNHVSSDNIPTDQEDTGLEDIGLVNEGDSFQMVNGEDGEAPEQEREESQELEPEPQPSKKSKGKEKAVEVSAPAAKRGRPKKTALEAVQEDGVDEPEAVLPKKRGRPSLDAPKSSKRKTGRPKKAVEADVPEEQEPEAEAEPEERPKKRTRRSLDVPEAEAVKQTGRPKKAAKDANIKEPKGKEKAGTEEPAKAKAKAPGRKPKLATIEEGDSPQVQRGPPMPRNNRGLFILRRETPLEGSGFQQTRSGRNSIKPVAYWKNERVEYSEDENEDGVGKFLMPRIKEVVRAEEVYQPKRKAARSKSKAPKSKKQSAESESEEEDINMEPWELEPGRIFGEVKNWDPEDPSGSQQEEVQEEIALSSAAIITRDIPHASFRFAKTLTLPFFGSGMVDLPAHSMKKSKNSRKMQMVFFVFYGRVQVTVNDNVFSIGKGGMWQVPRGNFYSIENDYDKPARIFFSQGCEVVEEVGAGESQ